MRRYWSGYCNSNDMRRRTRTMKISRVTILTLGVADLGKATEFYKGVLGTPPRIEDA